MIYFILGTKAQLIKSFPVLKRLRELGVVCSYIDTVQHGPLCEELRQILDVAEPDHFLAARGTQIERTSDAVRWTLQVLWRGWRRRREIFPVRGVVIVHGDTLSTLIGTILGKLCGQQVCHLEAGERTHNWRRPFPEEIIRRIVDRYSELMLACGDTQTANLVAERVRGRVVNLRFNTLLDSVQAVARRGAVAGPQRVLVSIHRFETITSRERMEFLAAAVEQISRSEKILWGLHPPTRRKLEEFGLLPRLERLANLELRGLMPYPEFVQAIGSAKFIVTDGGGPQEESYFLGTPCLLLRSETERQHPNVCMAGWSFEQVAVFQSKCAEYRRSAVAEGVSPSLTAADAIRAQANASR